MTEAEWMACADPEAMLDFLNGTATDRKMRLFAIACCRQPEVWRYLTHLTSRKAVETSEQFADSRTSPEELSGVMAAAPRGRETGGHMNAWFKVHLSSQAQADRAVLATGRSSGWDAAWEAGRQVVNFVDWPRQCDLLRDIFGSPFRPVTLNPSWLIPAVVLLAQTIYDRHTFERMPELADALERAGCTDRESLVHCRGPGPHVRGCCVVDLVLGKS